MRRGRPGPPRASRRAVKHLEPISTQQPIAPVPGGRIEAIDGLRGAFLLLMTLTHLTVPGGSILKAFHPDTIGFIDSATGFVFLSGMMVGLVYVGVARRRGLAEATRRLHRRALHLYGYAIGLIVLIAVASRLVPGASGAWAEWAGPITRTDWRSAVANLLMVQEASYADILPMYVVFLAFSPAAIWLCLRGRTVWLLTGSTLLWLLCQFGAAQPLNDALASSLAWLRPDLSQPDTFNLAAWQLLYVAGLAAGAAAGQGRLGFAPIFSRRGVVLAWLSLAVLAAIAITTVGLRMNHPGQWAEGGVQHLIDALARKSRLAIGCLVNFAALAYLIAWMLIAGMKVPGRLGWTSRLFARAVQWPFLTLLGRHSLQVYAWQVVVVYAVKLLGDRLGPATPGVNAAIILTGLAMLALPAMVSEGLPPSLRLALTDSAGPDTDAAEARMEAGRG